MSKDKLKKLFNEAMNNQWTYTTLWMEVEKGWGGQEISGGSSKSDMIIQDPAELNVCDSCQ